MSKRGEEYYNNIKKPKPFIINYPKSRYKTYSLSFYLKYIEKFTHGLFRGQKEEYKDGLIPKIFRKPKIENEVEFNNLEKIVLEKFKDRARPLLEIIPDDKDTLQWLAIAQHYGLRTRLLDWTQNALIALWFCVKNGAPKVINNNQVKFKRGYGVVYFLRFYENSKWSKEDIVNDEDKENPFNINKTKIFIPTHFSNRITAQSSIFTIHKLNKENGTVVPLEKEDGGRMTILKIPYGSFERIRRQLISVGINSSTVFPNLDGLCKYLNYNEYEIPEIDKAIIYKIDKKYQKN